MNRNDVAPGIRVKITNLSETLGLPIGHEYLAPKRVGVTGRVLRPLTGSSDEVWFVEHDDSTEIGAYAWDEMEPFTA